MIDLLAVEDPLCRLLQQHGYQEGDCLRYHKRDEHGRAYAYVGGPRYLVSRLVWMRYNGPITPDVKVRHTCDIRDCWNIDHLIAGTQSQNMQDMAIRCRGGKKLSCEDAAMMRWAYSQGLPAPEIAKAFNVSVTATMHIMRREYHAHLDVTDTGEMK